MPNYYLYHVVKFYVCYFFSYLHEKHEMSIKQSRTSSYNVSIYRLCQKKLYNFQYLFAEKVNKAQQQHSGGQNIIVLCKGRFLNGIIPWLGVKVMIH